MRSLLSRVRPLLPPALALLAFPNVVTQPWDRLSAGRLAVGPAACVLAALLLAAGRLRPRPNEPDVHDRQLDVILAAPLLAACGWLSLGWQQPAKLHEAVSNHEALSAVAFLGAACLLTLGTRATIRMGWPLLVACLAIPASSSRWPIGVAALAVAGFVLLRSLARNAGEPRQPSHTWPAARRAITLVAAAALALGAHTAIDSRPAPPGIGGHPLAHGEGGSAATETPRR